MVVLMGALLRLLHRFSRATSSAGFSCGRLTAEILLISLQCAVLLSTRSDLRDLRLKYHSI